MLNGGKAVRDKDGKIIEAAAFQKGEKDAKPGRVMPDRRWFGELPLPAWPGGPDV
jgi:nuclear GTP-binding protein